VTNAAPQSDQEAAKKPNPPGGDSTSAAGSQGDAKTETDKASSAGLSEVQEAQGHPGTSRDDGAAAATATADAGDQNDGAEADDSGESTAQAEVRQTLEKGGAVATAASPEVQAQLVASGTIPDVAVTTEVRDDGPEAGADQPGMVEKGSKSIWGSIKDGFTSTVSTIKDAGSAAIDFAVDPIGSMEGWWDDFSTFEKGFIQNINLESSLDLKSAKLEQRAKDLTSDVLRNGQPVSAEDFDALAGQRLDGQDLSQVREFLNSPWSDDNVEMKYDQDKKAWTDTDPDTGMVRTEHADGSVQLKLKNGVTITKGADGEESWIFSDGALGKSKDGQLTGSFGIAQMTMLEFSRKYEDAGEFFGKQAENFAPQENPWNETSQESAESLISSKLPDGIKLDLVEKALETPFFTENADTTYDSQNKVWIDVDKDTGLKRFEAKDGRVAVELPDGTKVTRNADGSQTYYFKDSTVHKSADGKYSVSDKVDVAPPGESGSAGLSPEVRQRLQEIQQQVVGKGSKVDEATAHEQLSQRVPNLEQVQKFIDSPFSAGELESKYDTASQSWIDTDKSTGMTRIQGPDGNVMVRLADGTAVKTDADGGQTWFLQDGIVRKGKDGDYLSSLGEEQRALMDNARDLVPNTDRLYSNAMEVQSYGEQQRAAVDAQIEIMGTSSDVPPAKARELLDPAASLEQFGKVTTEPERDGPNGTKVTVEHVEGGLQRTVTRDASGKVVDVHLVIPGKDGAGDTHVIKNDKGVEWSNRQTTIAEYPDGSARVMGVVNGAKYDTAIRDGVSDTQIQETDPNDRDARKLDMLKRAFEAGRLDEFLNNQSTGDGHGQSQYQKVGDKWYLVRMDRDGGTYAREVIVGENGPTLGERKSYDASTGTFDGVTMSGVTVSADGKTITFPNGRVITRSDGCVRNRMRMPDGTNSEMTTTPDGETSRQRTDESGKVLEHSGIDRSGNLTGVDANGDNFSWDSQGNRQTSFSTMSASGDFTNLSSGMTWHSNGDITDYQGHTVYDSSSGSWGGEGSSYARGGMTEAQAEAAVQSQVNGARTVAMPAFLEALSLGKTGGNVAGMLGRIEGGLGQISAAKALCIQLGAFDQLATLDSMMATGCAAQSQAVRVAGMEANAGIFMKGAVGNSFEMNQFRAKIANGTFISIPGEIAEWNKQHENA